jgi:sterol 3beta-glucosyltransferase
MEEFPAWLVKNVMIQGYMLVTERHICFFAALPRTDVLSQILDPN